MINLLTRSQNKAKNLLIFLTVLILFLVFSFKISPIQHNQVESQAPLSVESQQILKDLILKNIRYPYEAKNKNISGRFFVIVRMQKGGKIRNIDVIDRYKRINVPLLFNEITIMDKPTSSKSNGTIITEYVTNPLGILEIEAVRVTKMFESINLPEWQNKKLEFAISYNFKLTD